jgi:hypothetical protein
MRRASARARVAAVAAAAALVGLTPSVSAAPGPTTPLGTAPPPSSSLTPVVTAQDGGPARIIQAASTLGHVLTVHVLVPEEFDDVPRLLTTVTEDRRVVGSAAGAGRQRPGTRYWSGGTSGEKSPVPSSSPLLSASGPYSAVVEVDGQAQRLVLRRGSGITARLAPRLTPDLPPASFWVTSSGPITWLATRVHVGPASGGHDVLTVRWAGPDGVLRTVPPPRGGVRGYAVDGSRIAYWDRAGTTRLLDVVTPRSSGNPHVVARGAVVTTALTAAPSTWLSGRYLLQSRSVLDLVSGRRRHLTGDYRCPAVSGSIAVCQDNLSGVYTLDLAVRGSYFRRVPGLVAAWVQAAGRTVVSPEGDPASATQLRVTAIPADAGSVGRPRVLGPWASQRTVVRGRSCWAPEWSVSQSLTRWKVALRSTSGRLVRTWSGAAPDGALSGVRWCPSTAAAGIYRWTLTGSGPTGGPVATSGTGRATGTVALRRA